MQSHKGDQGKIEVGKYKIETDFASQAGNFKLISEFN